MHLPSNIISESDIPHTYNVHCDPSGQAYKRHQEINGDYYLMMSTRDRLVYSGPSALLVKQRQTGWTVVSKRFQDYLKNTEDSRIAPPGNWRHVSNDSTWGASEPESHETGETNLMHTVHTLPWDMTLRLMLPIPWAIAMYQIL